MAKLDIKSAFRNIPVHYDDQPLLGCKFLNGHYMDKCLPFGLSKLCEIFQLVSTAVEAIVRALLQNPAIMHYLDDFFGVK